MEHPKLFILSFLLPLLIITTSAQLQRDYYKKTCPNVESIVRNAVALKFRQTFVTAPGTLRLFFHDCFVRGCDASVLLSSPSNSAEKDHPDDISLAGDGFDTVIKAKAAVDRDSSCRNKVSCADILAMATRDVVALSGGPSYPVELGRLDGRISTKASVQRRLPHPEFSLDQLNSMFATNGLTQTDMIALSGAHTIGFSHCSKFSKRIYNFSPNSQVDPTIKSSYARQLQQMCPRNVDPTIAINMDPTTPQKFDNVYFRNLQQGMGLFTSDQILFTDSRSKNIVNLFASNNTAFQQAFITAITKLGRVGVKTGNQARIPSSLFPSLKVASQNNSANYTHVCDPKRFADMGLDMSQFAYCDSSLSFDIRVKDLVDRMKLPEKVQQLGDRAYGVSRLGLPKYEWWSEALHGVSNVGHGTRFDDLIPGATSFPTVILTAASFNESLWKNIGQVVSTEARAMYNLGRAGLTYWSPNINVVRDPRWGRITETPGEDPYVVGRYAVNYVRGLQDVEGSENVADLNSRPLKVSASCKHYAAYDVDNWLGVDRFHFDARVTEQDMLETFLRPFEMCVKDGDVSSVMCSYNRVNGIPTCADPKLLKETIRGDWNLHGYIVADCDSIKVMVNGHKWLGDTKEDAVAQVLKAGLDLDCGVYYTNFTNNAVKQGKVREGDIDKSLRYLYTVLMRLGFFDGSPSFMSLGKGDVCSAEHIELAAEAAREGIVLLKNDNNTLPLNSNTHKNLALIGPHANATNVMVGNYAGIPCQYTSPLDGFSKFGNVTYETGCANAACKNDSLIIPAKEVAKNADATILFVGLDLAVEAESLDRVDLLLPGYQIQLINQVAMNAKGPVILVIMSAGGIDISFAKNNPNIKAILWVGYPGEEGGRAIADVIFGKYNPGGKLPITWYEADYVDQLPMTSMPLRPIDEFGYPGRTYKFFNGSTVYPFGYGLSYTQFDYELNSSQRLLHINLDKYQQCRDLTFNDNAYRPPCPAVLVDDISCDKQFEFEVEVKNIGSVDGNEVVMVYSKPPSGIAKTHAKQVIGFKRVFVPVGASSTVKFVLDVCKSLSIVEDNGYTLIPSGKHTIMVGDGAISFPLQVNIKSS